MLIERRFGKFIKLRKKCYEVFVFAFHRKANEMFRLALLAQHDIIGDNIPRKKMFKIYYVP